MPERDHNSTVGAGLPWAFVLDPVANAAAINDVQRQGLEAARRLIDSIVAKSESSSVDGPDEPRTRPDPGEQPRQGDSLAELIRCWAQLTTEVLGKLGETGGRPASTGSETAPTTAVSVDGSEPGSSKHCLDVDSRGRLFAASEIRLTNPSARSVGPLVLHVEDLHTPDGRQLAGASVQFDPSLVDDLPPGSSRCVAVAVSTMATLTPGTYRGVIQSAAVPDLSLALQITVHPQGS